MKKALKGISFLSKWAGPCGSHDSGGSWRPSGRTTKCGRQRRKRLVLTIGRALATLPWIFDWDKGYLLLQGFRRNYRPILARPGFGAHIPNGQFLPSRCDKRDKREYIFRIIDTILFQ